MRSSGCSTAENDDNHERIMGRSTNCPYIEQGTEKDEHMLFYCSNNFKTLLNWSKKMLNAKTLENVFD
jgi:hypothetical protein